MEDNNNAFLLLNVLFKNFLSVPFCSFTNRSNIFKNAFYAFVLFSVDYGIILDRSVRSCKRTIVPLERHPALHTNYVCSSFQTCINMETNFFLKNIVFKKRHSKDLRSENNPNLPCC